VGRWFTADHGLRPSRRAFSQGRSESGFEDYWIFRMGEVRSPALQLKVRIFIAAWRRCGFARDFRIILIASLRRCGLARNMTIMFIAAWRRCGFALDFSIIFIAAWRLSGFARDRKGPCAEAPALAPLHSTCPLGMMRGGLLCATRSP
jgi:hypothetical protein